MNKMRILVTFANVYDMDGENGRRVSGCTLNYFFFGEDGSAMKPINDLSGGPVGYQRAKCSMDIEKRQKVSFVPALYDAVMEMTVGSDGKPVMKVVDLDFVSQVDIIPRTANASK